MTAAALPAKLLHAVKEAVLLPFAVLTFLFWELPKQVAGVVLCALYQLAQLPVIWAFKPPRPPKELKNPRGRIAVIGAGLTGVSSAAHAIAHGFDVVIYEKSDKVGGIWTSVNKTSGLQLNSILYRFFPSVHWSRFFPHRDEILSEIEKIWKEYHLEERTRFNTPVTSVKRADDGSGSEASRGDPKWIINDGADGAFDAVIVNIGTCGEPMMQKFPGMPGYTPSSHSEPNGSKHEHEDDTPHQDNGASKKPAWSSPDATIEAVKLKDGQRARKSPDAPTQDESAALPAKVGDVHGARVTTAGGGGVWDAVEEPTLAVGRDQASKKARGFPRPEEAFAPGPDVQKDTKRPEEQAKRRQKGKKQHSDEHKGQQDVDAGEEEVFEKPILHSSQLTSSGTDFKDKTVVVIGGGASSVEAVETALADGAKCAVMVVRDDKWIIPRNIVIDTLIAMQPFGMEMPLSFIWEKFITLWNYHGVADLTPAHTGLFQSTPVVNEEFLAHVRARRCAYVRGDVVRLTARGVRVNVRARGSRAGDVGEETEFDADVVVLATGFQRPDIGFLPGELFPEGYERPNLYLQNFPVEDWSVLMTNSAYMNAIGTVGHFHIGIYTRILLTFLMDPAARPAAHDMRLWVDAVRFVKRGARRGALGFFTYMELTIWLVLFHVFRPDRLRWMFFILNGWGVRPLK